MTKLTPQEKERYYRYRKLRRGSSINTCKVNELNIHMSNGYSHELAKFEKYWELRSNKENLLSECWISKKYNDIEEDERCDLVSLTTGERWEPETDMKRALRFMGRPVNIIPVGWKLIDKKWLKLKQKWRKDMHKLACAYSVKVPKSIKAIL